MIDKKLIPYGGLKKEPFSGTHHGMRYFFRGDDGKSSTTFFTVFIYPEPWCFEDTPEEDKDQKTFPLSDEGMDEAIAWLLERFETEKPKWTQAARDAMHIVNKQEF